MWYRILIIAAVTLTVVGTGAFFGFRHYKAQPPPPSLVLYGNVDDRQIALAFQVPERIAALNVEEGDPVTANQVLGQLDTTRILHTVNQAQAACDAAEQNYLKLKNGSRPEEIAIAQGANEAAQAHLENTRKNHQRQQELVNQRAASQVIADQAEADYLVAIGAAKAATNKLALLQAGPRAEEIAQAAAELAARQAELAIQRQKLADTTLTSPIDGIVRNRLLEPGEMAAPDRPALLIALTSPKWIRTYLSEKAYGQLQTGTPCEITVDSYPQERFEGWIGFISPTAEFTPKNVETPELRPDLVYEIRVMVKDPHHRLLLGQPATVTIPRVQVRP